MNDYLDSFRIAMLGFVFDSISQHLLMLDLEESGTDTERYKKHREYVNGMLRPLNFVVGITHLNRHCVLPLIESE